MRIKIKPEDGFKVPTYATDGSACFDLYAAEPFTILPNQTVAVSLGFKVELDKEYVLELVPRSGFAYKNNITLMNSPAKIDSDYRGVVKALIYNASLNNFTIKPGDRICQGSVEKVERAEFDIVEEISNSERAEGGFGSTGTK
jgi:dUTP pyrophosphatase